MDPMALKNAAIALRLLLDSYATADQEAYLLREALGDVLDRAIAERIDLPLQRRDIPGGWFFDEGSLRKYPDLELAYATFCIEARGGESPVLNALREDMGEKN